MRSYNKLNGQMLFVKIQYQNMVTNLRSSGYMTDLLLMIENMNADFAEKIHGLVKYIEDEHLAYIQVQADAIVDVINRVLKPQ